MARDPCHRTAAGHMHPAAGIEPVPPRAGAVVGSAVFGQQAPEHFGAFDVAFLTLFHVGAGEPWPDELPWINSDGSANWAVGGFSLTFTIIVHFVVLEVCCVCARARFFFSYTLRFFLATFFFSYTLRFFLALIFSRFLPSRRVLGSQGPCWLIPATPTYSSLKSTLRSNRARFFDAQSRCA